jgi:putative MATE family efflux protein
MSELTLREALAGKAGDYTTLPLRRAVMLLAVPMVLEATMESVFGIVDIFWVSRLGSDAVAGVGLTEGLMSVLYALALGLCAGATAVVSRRIGEKDSEGASSAAGQSIRMAIGFSTVIAVLGVPFVPELLRLLGAPSSVLDTATGYARLMLGGNLTVVLLFVLNAVFRGAGDPSMAMKSLGLGNALNIVLGPCFIYGWGPFPELGVAGAAVATNIGRGTAVLFQLVMLVKGTGHLQLRLRHLKSSPAVRKSLFAVGGVASFQILLETCSWLGLVTLMARFGSAALAGYTLALRIALFVLFPAWGMANAAATLVGQNLGAKNPERAEKAVWVVGASNVALLAVASVLIGLMAPLILRLFDPSVEVAAVAVPGLRIIALGFVFFSLGMVMVQGFNGAGDAWTPTLLNVACFWALKLPLAWLLAVHLDLGPPGIFWAVTVAYSVLTGSAIVLFRRGRWKLKQV